ncbi:hypothetical protein GGS26DRAFT_439002 [Hypomontagnella submonticulosa]|nr:hypothetical protein GGS26DRAFT_439002 [Hypomontagnella submonticulosa]
MNATHSPFHRPSSHQFTWPSLSLLIPYICLASSYSQKPLRPLFSYDPYPTELAVFLYGTSYILYTSISNPLTLTLTLTTRTLSALLFARFIARRPIFIQTPLNTNPHTIVDRPKGKRDRSINQSFTHLI